MKWTTRDLEFFRILSEYGERYILPHFQKTALYLHQHPLHDPSSLVLFGEYSREKRTFQWKNKMNRLTDQHIRKHYARTFRSISTLSKLFHPQVIRSLSEQWVGCIPYLMKLVHPAFHVVHSRVGSIDSFYLIQLPLSDDIPFEIFEDLMNVYRLSRTMTKKKKRSNVKKRGETRK